MDDNNKNSISLNFGASKNETRLNMLYEIGRILASTETMNEAAPQILEVICRFQQFDVGELWSLSDDETILRRKGVWHSQSAKLETFVTDSRTFEFSVGDGLPGRVWKRIAPIWIEDLSVENDLERRIYAERAGMRSAFAFPILLGEKFLGAFCFFCQKQCPQDEELLKIFVAVGNNIGQFIKRERVESNLRESEENFRALVEASSQAIWTTDIKGQHLEAFGWWENQTGQTREESAGAGFLKAIHRQDRERIGSDWQTAMSVLKSFETECRIADRTGDYRHFAIRGVPVFNADQSFRQWVGTLTDIHERKIAEEKIRESQEVFSLAMSSSRMGAWSRDLENDTVYWSAELEEIFGLPAGTFSGNLNGFYDYVYPEDKDSVMREVWTAIEEHREYIIEFRFRHADGSLRWMEGRGQSIYNADGKPIKVYGIGIDITERKQSEENLRESEDRFRNLANSISQLAWIANATGHIFWYNERWFEYTGTTLEEMQGWDWQKVHHPEEVERVAEKFRQHLVSGEIWEDTFPIRSKSGEYRWFLSRAQPIRDENNRIIRWFGTNTDITERREIEAERERLLVREQRARELAEQTNLAKDEFIALVSHELRSPLNAMLGWSRILQEKKTDEKTLKYALDVIIRNALSQSRLIEDLLDIARLGKGKLRIELAPLELAPIIDAAVETVKPSAEAKNIKFDYYLDRGANLIVGDNDRLRQVVENLLSNAVKFTPDDGSVSVRLEREGTQAKLIISDTGHGISAEFLPQIFERFKQADASATRRYGGLGIGLSLARDLVELHGGTIEAQSEGEGKGTTFTVTLPLRTVN